MNYTHKIFYQKTLSQNPANVIFYKILLIQNYILAIFQRKYTHPALRMSDILQMLRIQDY